MQKPHFTIGLARLALGWIFFWAFLDKTFGLGFATAADNAWLNGGSPTTGFLTNAVRGPFADFFQSLAGIAIIDWIFMLGLFGVGITLLLGIKVKLGSWIGAVMLFLMWLALLPPENNPFMDNHIVYALVLISFSFTHAGHTLGLGKWWSNFSMVKKWKWLE